MGMVEFGAEEEAEGFRPFIKIVGDFGTVEYKACHIFKSIESTKDFCVGTYKVLSGKQTNFKLYEEGKFEYQGNA